VHLFWDWCVIGLEVVDVEGAHIHKGAQAKHLRGKLQHLLGTTEIGPVKQSYQGDAAAAAAASVNIWPTAQAISVLQLARRNMSPCDTQQLCMLPGNALP
jgi:hypothetical protein